MKKILPVIITLICLSLLGLIILQASWLNNLVQLRAAQISGKINEASSTVSFEIGRTLFSKKSSHKNKRLQRLSFTNDLFNVLRPKMVSEHYSMQDINDKLKSAFNNEELKKIKFDFAIANSSGDYEMQTANYAANFFDSTSNKKFFYPIMPDMGTELEGINQSHNLILIVPDFRKQVWGSLLFIILGSALFTLVIFAAFFITIRTLFNQKKISEIKSDFINNMTHEFKTPLATISLAIDSIKNKKVQSDIEKIEYFSNIIKEENIRMNKHVETILQAALIEKKELQYNFQKINTHLIIADVFDNFQLQLIEKNATYELLLNATDNLIYADALHFTNAISNLIDNAIKYSKENLKIIVRTYNKNKSLFIVIEDNGIGMNKETVKHIFEKFYRAHTGNLHNIKGFGLGMSYVKTIMDAINGKIKIESSLTKGTTFTIEIPIEKK